MTTSRPVAEPEAAPRVGRRNFSLVTAGTAMGQVFLALSIPAIARIYEPSAVGRFALVMSVAQLLGIAVTGRIEQVLPRLDPQDRWAGLLVAVLPMAVLVPVMVGVAAVMGVFSVGLLLAGGVLVLSLGLFNAASLAVLADQRYRLLGSMRLVNGLLTAVGQVVGGLIVPSAAMLTFTYALGNLVACCMAIGVLARLWASRGGTSVMEVFRKDRLGIFAFTVGGSALMSNFSLSLPIIAFSGIYGSAVVGSFFLARKLLMVPTQLVASTVSEVSYAMIARAPHTAIKQQVTSWMGKLRLAALLTLLVGVVTAPLADWLIGSDYVDLWQVVLILSVAAAAQLVATSLSNVLLALHEERIRFAWNVFRLVGLVLLFLACDWAGLPYLTAVALMTAYLTVTYMLLLLLTLRTLDRKSVTG